MVAELARRREEPVLVGIIGTAVVVAVVGVVLGGALRILPGGVVTTDASGVTTYNWLGLKWHEQNVSAGRERRTGEADRLIAVDHARELTAL